jgi:hypothetical protein
MGTGYIHQGGHSTFPEKQNVRFSSIERLHDGPDRLVALGVAPRNLLQSICPDIAPYRGQGTRSDRNGLVLCAATGNTALEVHYGSNVGKKKHAANRADSSPCNGVRFTRRWRIPTSGEW